jgi:K+-transporting ATPase ATPase C chain
MLRATLTGFRMLAVMTVLTGVVYPLAVWGVGRAVFPAQADGSFVMRDGEIVGSMLLGQRFDGAAWFHGRPDAFDPSASGPSNLGPTNPAFGEAVSRRLDRLGADVREGVTMPVDAVTSSASGLDPHISPAYARVQAPRIADARGLEVDDVVALIDEHTEGRTAGVLGEPRVNVLALNLALDELAPLS